MSRFRRLLYCLLSLCLLLPVLGNNAHQPPASALSPHDGQFVMFDDSERSGWFSHGNPLETATSPTHAGTKSLSFTKPNWTYQFTMGWESSCWSAPFDRLEFWIHGGTVGGQTLALTGLRRDVLKNTFENGKTITLPNAKYITAFLPGRWEKVSIPLADLGVANRTDFRGIQLDTQATVGFFIDDMALLGTPPASATISVSALQVVRRLNDHVYGINTYGVPQASNAAEVATAREAGYRLHRAFYPTFGVFGGIARGLPFAEATGADAIGCVLYTDVEDFDGKKFGTPEQAAAMVAYANVPVDAPKALLDFRIGVDAKGHDWGTVRKWVQIRSREEKLPQDDHFNVMRIKHPKPFAVKYWELDNEPWLRTRDTDWKAYAQWCKTADRLMRRVDPSIQTGVSLIGGDENPGLVKHEVANPATGKKHTGFNEVVLYYLSGQDQAQSPGKYRPDFIICHNYAGTSEGPSADLATLFTYQQRNGSDWATRAQAYRELLRQYYGTEGVKPYFLVTENNTAATFPLSKQTQSLVTGLYVADDLASLMLSKEGDFEGLTWHDWDDGPLDKGSYIENRALYGWRTEAGYGVYRDGTRTRYPAHYAFRLLSTYFGQGGDDVLIAESSTPYLAAYAVKQKNGNLAVLLINKTQNTTISATVALQGYNPSTTATLYRYGKEEDRQESDISVAPVLDSRKPILCPGYSLSVVTLTKSDATPMPPTELRASAGNSRIALVWTAMSGARGYDLYRRQGQGVFQCIRTDQKETSFIDKDVKNGTAYTYAVSVHGHTDKRSPTASAMPVAPPGPVSGLAAVAADEQVHLTWNATATATSYAIYRSPSPSGPFSLLSTHPYERHFDQTLSLTSYRDSGLNNGVRHYYRVSALNAGGAGPAATIAAQPIAVPSPWKALDLSGRPHGVTRVDSATGAFLLAGEGQAWYGQGEGRFVYQKWQGDGTITARVVAGEPGLYGKNTFGVMLRDGLETGKEVRWALMALTPAHPQSGFTQGPSFMSSGPGSANQLVFQSDTEPENRRRIRPPYWIRLTRRGDTVTGYLSPDGSSASWKEFGKERFPGLSQNIYLGLIANSMVYFAPLQGHFDQVQVE